MSTSTEFRRIVSLHVAFHHLVFLFEVDLFFFFFFQAEDGIRDVAVTGVQTCALPILGIDITPNHCPTALLPLTCRLLGEARFPYTCLTHQHHTLRMLRFEHRGSSTRHPLLAVSANVPECPSRNEQLSQNMQFMFTSHQRALIAAPNLHPLRYCRHFPIPS